MKKKLNIDQLKVQSFITELKSEHAQTAKGGNDDTTTLTISYVLECEFTTAENCHESGAVTGEASEVVTEYGCMLPEIIIC